jgi:hypothetical protein
VWRARGGADVADFRPYGLSRIPASCHRLPWADTVRKPHQVFGGKWDLPLSMAEALAHRQGSEVKPGLLRASMGVTACTRWAVRQKVLDSERNVLHNERTAIGP